MNTKEYTDPEGEPQTPEEVDDVPEDDAAGIQNDEQDDDSEGTEGKPMTMEERKAKMQKLRAKMVRPVSFPEPLPSLQCLFPAVVRAREPCLCDRGILEV